MLKLCTEVLTSVGKGNIFWIPLPYGVQSNFWPKILILAKNPTFGQKSNFWPKILILTKNSTFNYTNFAHKSKFDKKNRNLIKKSKFDKKI